MTPQSLSIADLKAVIDDTNKLLEDPHFSKIHFACLNEYWLRINHIHPPTEPNKEERK